MDNTFWSVLKANAIIAVCSILLTFSVAFIVAIWRRRKLKKMVAHPPKEGEERRPQMYIFGVEEPKPGHCPLCGRDWPLPGPERPPLKPKDALI